MPTAPPAPPVISQQTSTSKQTAGVSSGESGQVFKLNGDNPEHAAFEFLDPAVPTGSVLLKAVVRQYVGAPQMRSVPAKQMYMILGRLRCLEYAIKKYNEGVESAEPSFLQYWRRRVLNTLSVFGFQVTSAQQKISVYGLSELIVAIEGLYRLEIEAARETIGGGLITFDALGELYRPFQPVQGQTTLGGTAGVFMVTDIYYEEHRSLLGMEKSFHWSMEFVVTMGEHFTIVAFTEVLSGWTGVRARPLSDLSYIPIEPSQAGHLTERGKKYASFATGGPRFLAYTPNSFFIHGGSNQGALGSLARSGSSQLPSGGRLMVDPLRGAVLGHHASSGVDEPTQNMITMAGRYKRWRNAQGGSSSHSQDAMILWDSIPNEFLMYCWPAVVGFSFSAKAWGHVLISGLEPMIRHLISSYWHPNAKN